MPSCHIKDADVPTERNLIHKSVWDFLVSEQQQLILGLRFFSCPCPDTISTAQYVTMSVEHHYSIRHFTTLLRDPGRLWHLRNIIRVIRRHDLSNKKTNTKIMTKTFRKHLQREIFNNFDQEYVKCEWRVTDPSQMLLAFFLKTSSHSEPLQIWPWSMWLTFRIKRRAIRSTMAP